MHAEGAQASLSGRTPRLEIVVPRRAQLRLLCSALLSRDRRAGSVERHCAAAMPRHGRPRAAPRLTGAIDPSELQDDPLGPRHHPSTSALALARASSRAQIQTIYRAESYRIPGQRHPSIHAASFMLRATPDGSIMDMLFDHPTLADRTLARFEQQVAALEVAESVRRSALRRARFLLRGRGGLQRLRTEVDEMASASSHRAFCWCAAAPQSDAQTAASPRTRDPLMSCTLSRLVRAAPDCLLTTCVFAASRDAVHITAS